MLDTANRRLSTLGQLVLEALCRIAMTAWSVLNSILPCTPVARGQKVTTDAMTHPVCQSRAAKAFLLHAQNALLEWIVSANTLSVANILSAGLL
jgi:hypothetical protein